MPYLARSYRDLVEQPEVDADSRIVCPACNKPVTPVEPDSESSPVQVGHFRHKKSTPCNGDHTTQERIGYIAKGLLQRGYSDGQQPVQNTTLPGTDQEVHALLEFETETEPFGNGIAVRVFSELSDEQAQRKFIQSAHEGGYSAIAAQNSAFDPSDWTGNLPGVVIGSPDDEFDLVKQLSENNAPRSCASCSQSADFYLFKENALSNFFCDGCIKMDG